MRMIRYGILGFGHHAIKRMLPGFAGAQSSQLIGIWRRDPAKAAANAREYGIQQVFTSADELCASPEIDAVFIASPDSLHLTDVLTAARHGKHVLCEKPLAMHADEVEEMLAAVDLAGVRFGVAQNMRYYRSLETMRRWIDEGRIGTPALATAQFAYNAEKSPRVWICDPSLALGGPIGDVAIHCMDALRFILGATVTEVSTLAHKDALSGAVESHAALALAFSTGVMGSVTVTTRTAYRTSIEVVGETGVILCENGLTVDYPVDVVLRRGPEIETTERVSNHDAYSRMLDGFSAWVGQGEEYRATGDDGLLNQLVLDAAYRSWRSGKAQTTKSAD
jgi:predicted dehydrogenase